MSRIVFASVLNGISKNNLPSFKTYSFREKFTVKGKKIFELLKRFPKEFNLSKIGCWSLNCPFWTLAVWRRKVQWHNVFRRVQNWRLRNAWSSITLSPSRTYIFNVLNGTIFSSSYLPVVAYYRSKLPDDLGSILGSCYHSLILFARKLVFCSVLRQLTYKNSLWKKKESQLCCLGHLSVFY